MPAPYSIPFRATIDNKHNSRQLDHCAGPYMLPHFKTGEENKTNSPGNATVFMQFRRFFCGGNRH